MVIEHISNWLIAAGKRDSVIFVCNFSVEAFYQVAVIDCQSAVASCEYNVVIVNRNVGDCRSEANFIGAGAVIGDNVIARAVDENICALAASQSIVTCRAVKSICAGAAQNGIVFIVASDLNWNSSAEGYYIFDIGTDNHWRACVVIYNLRSVAIRRIAFHMNFR